MESSPRDHGPLCPRWMRVLVLALPALLGVAALGLTRLVDHMAVHLCGWPATVSCDFGVPVTWPVLIGGLWTVAVVSAVDAVAFVVAPDPAAGRRMITWTAWGVAVALATVTLMADRTLHTADLVLGAVLVLWSLALIARAVGDRLRLSRRVLIAAFTGPAVAVLLIPAWAPPAFRAAELVDPARQDEARRRSSRECLEDLASRRAEGGSPTRSRRACGVHPSPELHGEDSVSPAPAPRDPRSR